MKVDPPLASKHIDLFNWRVIVVQLSIFVFVPVCCDVYY